MDGALCMNMQKYATEQGVQLIGQEAIRDTMEDLMVDAGGALIVCIAGLLFLRSKRRKKRERGLPENKV